MSNADINIAFLPFENYVYDLRGFISMMDDLELVQRSLFRGKEGTISFKARDFTMSGIISLFEQIENAGLEPAGDQKQQKFLMDLSSYLKTLPVLKLTLAFSPTNTFLERLSNQVTTIIGTKTLLDVLVDEYIVGGAIFEFKGKISKHTLDEQLEGALRRF
jgi:hypothetical protein